MTHLGWCEGVVPILAECKRVAGGVVLWPNVVPRGEHHTPLPAVLILLLVLAAVAAVVPLAFPRTIGRAHV